MLEIPKRKEEHHHLGPGGTLPSRGRKEEHPQSKFSHSLLKISTLLLALSLPLNLLMIQGAVILLCIAILLSFFSKEQKIIQKTPLTYPIIFYCVVAFISHILSPYSFRAYTALAFWPVLYFFPAFLTINYFLRVEKRWLLILGCAALGMTLLMSVYAGIQYFTGLDFLRYEGEQVLKPAPFSPDRFKAVANFNRHTTMAFSFLFPFSFVFALIFQKKLKFYIRAAAIAALLIIGMALMFSYCRAVWFGFGFGLIVMAALSRTKSLIVATLVGCCLIGGTLLFIPSTRLKILSTFDLENSKSRLFMWARTIEMVRDYPVTGIGFGNYKRATYDYYDPVNPDYQIRSHAHNLALHFIAEMGPLGLLAFVWIWVVFYQNVFRATERFKEASIFKRVVTIAAVVGISGLLFGSFTQDPVFDGAIAFMLWTATAAGLATFSLDDNMSENG